jgi:hypothetical protein
LTELADGVGRCAQRAAWTGDDDLARALAGVASVLKKATG